MTVLRHVACEEHAKMSIVTLIYVILISVGMKITFQKWPWPTRPGTQICHIYGVVRTNLGSLADAARTLDDNY